MYMCICAGDVIVGTSALKPEYRHAGTVVRPLLPIAPGTERYTMHTDVMRCVLHKVFEDLRILPGNYHVRVCTHTRTHTCMLVDYVDRAAKCAGGDHRNAIAHTVGRDARGKRGRESTTGARVVRV
jgi:hypothetical protein